MKNNKFQLAIVGFGGMGNWHRELIASGIDDKLEVKGMFDIKQDRLDAAKELGYVAYSCLEELLADEDIDIVLVSTPNECHNPITIRALNAGKNVVSEKPVCLSSKELKEMIKTAEKTGKLFTVHQNRRWDEDYLTIKKIFDEKLLGNVYRIESRVHGSRGIPGDWRAKKENGGGMVLDWGIHIIDQALQMIDSEVVKINCTLDNVTCGEVDDGFQLTLTFKNGIVYYLEVGTSNFIELPRWYMLGDNGTAIINDWALHGNIVRITDWNKNDAVPIKTAAGLTKTMAPRTEETIKTEELPIVHSDIKDFYRNIMATISGKETQKIKHNELLRSMAIMEAAFKSAQKGQALKVTI